MCPTAYIGLGSNLGDRQNYLDAAIEALEQQPGISVGKVSSYYEYEAEGGPPGQPDYLNAVAEVTTDLSPQALLAVLLDIEKTHGRARKERYGPRTLDLDLLLYDDVVHKSEDLTIPHPRLHE